MDEQQRDLDEAMGLVVDGLIAKHGWQLLSRDSFVQQASAHFRAGLAADVRAAAIGTYSQALYEACANTANEQRQERGYSELGRYLYSMAYRRTRNERISEELTQAALVHVFEAIDRCRKPVAFLAFAAMYLHYAAKSAWREQAVGETLQEGDGDEQETLYEGPDQSTDPAQVCIAQELRREVKEMLDAVRLAHPRAGRQIDAVELTFLEDLTEAEISARLATPVKNVYVLRSRGIDLLRSDVDFNGRAIDLGLW